MAFIVLRGGNFSDGHLGDQAIYSYGFFDDTVLITDSDFWSYQVETWEGNDYVHNARSTFGTGPTIFVSLGAGNDRFAGGAGPENVRDDSGNDTIDLAGGNDVASVGSGNDVIIGGAGTDTLSFGLAPLDYETIANIVGVTCDLAKTQAQNFGIFGLDTVTGFENVSGGNGSDKLFGTTGANKMEAERGNDLLDGRVGNDTMLGGSGSDILIGGAGADVMTGLDRFNFEIAARDTFRYATITDSGITAATWDTINSFDSGTLATDDRIDLSLIDANPLLAGNQAFVFRGAGAFTAVRGEVRLVVSGADTFVHVDNDTDAAAEMIIKVAGVTGLTAADFLL